MAPGMAISYPPPNLQVDFWSPAHMAGFERIYQFNIALVGHRPYSQHFTPMPRTLEPDYLHPIWQRSVITKNRKLWKSLSEKYVHEFIEDWKRAHK
jgi:hypothetical protein